MIEELGISQKVWLDNVYACMISFVNSLNFDNTGIQITFYFMIINIDRTETIELYEEITSSIEDYVYKE